MKTRIVACSVRALVFVIWSLLCCFTPALSQIPSPIQTPKLTIKLPKLTIPSVNRTFSPKYIDATKKFLKSTPKTLVGTNNGAAAVSTVKLLRGGSEGISDNSTETDPSQSGAYTCLTRSVNATADYFRQPLFEQHNVVFPGALYDATDIINNNVRNFPLPVSYQRRPYRISANLFTMTGTPANPTETIGDGAGEDYSIASYRAALSLILNRNSTANPPVEAFIEYIEANTKEEVALKLGYSNKVNVPAELTMLVAGVPVGVNSSVSAEQIANTINEKSRLILKVNYNFFSVNASPTDENGLNLMAPAPGNDLPNNLAWVSSVLYGTTGYVYFESDKTVTELQSTLNETIGISGPLNQGSAQLNISAEARAKFASTVSKMVAFGRGLGIQPGSSIAVASLDNLMALIGTLRNWGPNNQGSPIAYTMNFVKFNDQAVVSYNSQFPNKVCTHTPLSDLRYDVDLELDHFTLSNVRDLDGTEDLYGSLDFTNLKAKSKTVSSNINFFSKSEANANENSFRNGSSPIDKRFNLVKNLSFDELRNIELTVGGRLSDDEGLLGSRVFKCISCSDFNGDYGTRILKFIEYTITQTDINTLVNNGDYQLIKFGGDNFFQLDFHESNNANDGITKTFWRVWVKPHL